MDRDLVDSLFARYREPVYRFLRRMLRDGPAAHRAFLLRGNSYVVNFKPFYEGHRVTLVVQARRQK